MEREDTLNQLLKEIESAKAGGARGVYKIMYKATDEAAIYARDYLIANTPYRIDFHKCPRCAFEWDIMIDF